MKLKRILRSPLFLILAAVLVILLAAEIIGSSAGYTEVDTSEAIAAITDGDAQTVTLVDRDQEIKIELKDGSKIKAQYIEPQGALLTELVQQNPPPGGQVSEVPTQGLLVSLLISLLPIVIVIGLLFFFMTQMQGGGSRVMNFGKSKAKVVSKDMPQTTFADVAGADEAVEELEEIKDFLQAPAKFQAVGAKIPKGVLLYGPPGNRQDAARPRCCWRGRRAVLLHLRVGLRRDVRRRRRLSGA